MRKNLNEIKMIIGEFVNWPYEEFNGKNGKTGISEKDAKNVKIFLAVMTMMFTILSIVYMKNVQINILSFMYLYAAVLCTVAAIMCQTYYCAIKSKKAKHTGLTVTMRILAVILVPMYIVMLVAGLFAPKSIKQIEKKTEFVIASSMLSLVTVIVETTVLVFSLPWIVTIAQRFFTEDKMGILIALFIIAGLGLIGWLIICIAKTLYKRLHKSQDESTINDAISRMEKLRKFTFVVVNYS